MHVVNRLILIVHQDIQFKNLVHPVILSKIYLVSAWLD